jgi:hypothetical protein
MFFISERMLTQHPRDFANTLTELKYTFLPAGEGNRHSVGTYENAANYDSAVQHFDRSIAALTYIRQALQPTQRLRLRAETTCQEYDDRDEDD